MSSHFKLLYDINIVYENFEEHLATFLKLSKFKYNFKSNNKFKI